MKQIACTIQRSSFNKRTTWTIRISGTDLVAATAAPHGGTDLREPDQDKVVSTQYGARRRLDRHKYVATSSNRKRTPLHKNADVAEAIQQKIQESEKERKAIAGVTKLARERAKKANLHNKKLRDCRIHLNDAKGDRTEESCIFITEGDSASGSITKSRDPNTSCIQPRGKPFNSFGLTKKVVMRTRNSTCCKPPSILKTESNDSALQQSYRSHRCRCGIGMYIRLLLITSSCSPSLTLSSRRVRWHLGRLVPCTQQEKTLHCYSGGEIKSMLSMN